MKMFLNLKIRIKDVPFLFLCISVGALSHSPYNFLFLEHANI